MDNQIWRLESDKLKSFGFNESKIMISSKKYNDFAELETASAKPGLLETFATIKIDAITSMAFNEKEETLTIHHTKDSGKSTSDSFQFSDVGRRESIAEAIGNLKFMKKIETNESATSALLWNLGGVLLAIIIAVVARNLAVDAENGEHYEATGRRSGIMNLLVGIVESAGSLVVTIVGLLVIGLLAYKTYNRYKNPAKVVTYQ